MRTTRFSETEITCAVERVVNALDSSKGQDCGYLDAHMS